MKSNWFSRVWFRMFGEISGYLRMISLITALAIGIPVGLVLYVAFHFIGKYW